MLTLPPFNIFGSDNSQDYDVLFFVPQEAMGDLVSMIALTKDLNARMEAAMTSERLYSWKPKPVNSNLAVLDKDRGIIREVFKGTWDEVNNSVFHTYRFHLQLHSRMVTQLVEREVDTKVLRTFRVILSFLSRTRHRHLVKNALGSSLAVQFEAVKAIDLSEFRSQTALGKRNVRLEDYYKVMAFQFGQTLALMHQYPAELYTKDQIGEYYPDLARMLARTPEGHDTYAQTLENMKGWLLVETQRLYTQDQMSTMYERLT
jgi:hypothetical protein